MSPKNPTPETRPEPESGSGPDLGFSLGLGSGLYIVIIIASGLGQAHWSRKTRTAPINSYRLISSLKLSISM